MGWSDFIGKFPNQASDFDRNDLGILAEGAYEDTLPEWARASGQLGDYQRHIFNTSWTGLASGGNPLGPGYMLDYEQDRNRGDSDYATEEGLENAGMSAAILAAIFGGSSLFGGGGSSAGGSGGSAAGSGGSPFSFGTSMDSGFGSMDLLGSGAYGSTGAGVSGGAGGTYGGLLSGAGGAGAGVGSTAAPLSGSIGGSSYTAPEASGSWFDKLGELGESMGEGMGGGQGQQQGGYDSILDNMLKLSPWTVAKRDPNRMAALLAMLRGQKQGGVLGY